MLGSSWSEPIAGHQKTKEQRKKHGPRYDPEQERNFEISHAHQEQSVRP